MCLHFYEKKRWILFSCKDAQLDWVCYRIFNIRFGLFGIIWTCLAGFICYSYYKNAYTDEGMPAYEISIDEDVSQIEERLKKLDHLYNNGLITRDEYDEKRKEILNQI